MNPKIRSYLGEKYGFSEDNSDEALRNAIEQANNARMVNSLSRAGTTIGAALAGTRPNYSFNDEMTQMAQAPVNDLMNRRKARADDLSVQNTQLRAAKDRSLLDPESAESQTFRRSVESNFPQMKQFYGDSWDSVSAADKELIFQPLQLREQIQARRKKEDLSLLSQKLSLMDKLNTNNDIEHLPAEDREVVKELSKKNAQKQSITNQIDSAVKLLENPRVEDDQKLSQGRQLLKTLNSTEGADAIGKEEAERLGSYLKFNFMNLTEPGPFFGRDLKSFAEQAKLTSGVIKDAIHSNEGIIGEKYRKSGIPRSVPLSDWENKKQKAIEWANQNPNDPRSREILKRLNHV